MNRDMCTHTHTYTHRGIHSVIKKNEILAFAATWMELEGIMLSEISQTEKNKYCMIPHLELKKGTTNRNITKRKQTRRYIKQISSSSDERGILNSPSYLENPAVTREKPRGSPVIAR